MIEATSGKINQFSQVELVRNFTDGIAIIGIIKKGAVSIIKLMGMI